jgi:hypothetical protein
VTLTVLTPIVLTLTVGRKNAAPDDQVANGPFCRE